MRRTGLIVTLALVLTSNASADGERTPMIGGAVVWLPSVESPSGIGGFEVEAAWWHGRLGFAIEGSTRSDFAEERHALGLGGSLRLLLAQGLQRSLLEARDVEVGLELQGIVERLWWQRMTPDADPFGYGFGVALRVRGGSDDGSTRIAESRFFVRFMTAPATRAHVLERSTMATVEQEPRDLKLLVGIGASWGAADRRYLDRFRWQQQPDWR
jgi:hypothetical protein